MLNDRLKRRFKGKKILIVGLGLQGGGVGLVRFFSTIGAQTRITDLKSKEQLKESIKKIKKYRAQLILGKHDLKDFLWADIIFKGPSVPWDLPYLEEAIKKEIPVEMEASFFASVCPAKIIGITGTRGKSTTTMMIYEIFRVFKKNIFIGGNLSNISTIALLNKVKKGDWVILELSSQQLSGFHQKKISPHIAVFTNFYPDHLNYYKDINDYIYDKKAIYLYQNPEDYLIIHKSLLQYINIMKSKVVTYSQSYFPYQLKFLRGQHNRENAAAALRVADILKLDHKKSTQIISQFAGLPYRQQIVGKKNNTVFVNDSTSTTPIATIQAIESFKEDKIILILGGNSKNLPFSILINQLIKIEKIVLLTGSFTDEILPILKEKYPEKITPVFDDLEKAVKEAYRLTKQLVIPDLIRNPDKIDSRLPFGFTQGKRGNDSFSVYILFSPAATSFAMFKNEFHRGDEFNRIVKKIVRN